MKKDDFFARMAKEALGLAYDDVRLRTGYSEVDPRDVCTKSWFSRNIPLGCPIVSAAMDTVTRAPMAIALAKFGGMGVIHKAMTPEEQAAEVKKVKLHLNGLIEKPISVREDMKIQEIREMRKDKEYGFHTFPVTDNMGKLVGLLTRNNFDFCEDRPLEARQAMTPIGELVTAPAGTNLECAYKLLREKRKKVLPLISDTGELKGMYVFSDVQRLAKSSSLSCHNTDAMGHLRVAAAIGTGEEELGRASLLVMEGCDVIVIDTAHGDSKNVYQTLKAFKTLCPEVDVVVGNVSEPESARRLADAGADGIKVGQGPGSICTTRIIAGVGCPQVTAIYGCSLAIRGSGIPICADGGIRNSGDIPIAIAAGASCVMLGRTLAGTSETPGLIKETRTGRVKVYRGMGSLGAMQANRASRERYRQDGTALDKLVPEGVESTVPYQGSVEDVLFRQIGGLRAGMGYVGAGSIAELQEKGDFHRMTGAGLQESHPHDVSITESQR